MLHKDILCIIPARKGSKGIKNKNLKKVKGKPLVQYSIDTAKKIQNLVDICISTDSLKIKKIILKNKIKFYGLRPKNLSGDFAQTRMDCNQCACMRTPALPLRCNLCKCLSP